MNYKILICVPTLVGGGMERAALNFAISLNRIGCTVKIFTVSSNYVYFDVPAEIEILFGKKRAKDTWLAPVSLYKLRKFSKKFQPDYVLSFSGKMSAYIIIAMMGLKIPVIPFHRGNPDIKYGTINNWLNMALFPNCLALAVQTNQAKKIFTQKFNHKNVILVPNPMMNIAIQKGIPRDNIIVNVSRLVNGKGLDSLIRIFASLKPKDWCLQILGDGPLRGRLEQLAKELGISDKVHFAGFQKDVAKYLSKASVFSFASESEGFPNALLEAMCSGLACISFDCPTGPSDMIIDGKNGFLVDMGRNEDYANKLKMLITNKELRNEFSREAIKLKERHNPNKIAKRLIGDLERL